MTALNAVSQNQSDPVEVHVVEPLADVTITVSPDDHLVGAPLRFEARHYSGSDVTYTWDFGDGNVTAVHSDEIIHVYNM